MIFEPEPGTILDLQNETLEFVPLEASGPASVFVYAESGREGTVYKVLKGSEYYALKVFYPEYRDIRLLENTQQLSRFKNLEGFRVAARTVLTHDTFPELVSNYPDLNFAVLMPWIEGTLWGNLMMQNDQILQPEKYLTIAQALIRAVRNLEYQGAAHCDLSNNNFIIDKTHTAIQLIDIEDMYAPDMPRPIPDISYGTIGYRTKWIAQNGLWGPDADRFASALLCAELITWHNQEIRDNKSGDVAFFDEAEIGENSERYQLMTRYLGDLGGDLPLLFKEAWFAEEPNECPSAADWTNALRKLGGSETFQKITLQEPPTIIHFKTKTTTDSQNILEHQESPRLEVENTSEASQALPENVPQESTTTAFQQKVGTESDFINTPEILDELTMEVSQASQTDFQLKEDLEINAIDTLGNPDKAAVQVEIESEITQTAAQQESSATPKPADATIIGRGVPPKMKIDLETLDFGTLGKKQNSLRLHISNSGGAVLQGSIHSEAWIDVSPKEFNIVPGGAEVITASMNSRFPKPKTGFEYRTASALIIESNIGGEIIGARYKLEKTPFYKLLWVRVLAGGTVGLMCICLIAVALYLFANR